VNGWKPPRLQKYSLRTLPWVSVWTHRQNTMQPMPQMSDCTVAVEPTIWLRIPRLSIRIRTFNVELGRRPEAIERCGVLRLNRKNWLRTWLSIRPCRPGWRLQKSLPAWRSKIAWRRTWRWRATGPCERYCNGVPRGALAFCPFLSRLVYYRLRVVRLRVHSRLTPWSVASAVQRRSDGWWWRPGRGGFRGTLQRGFR